MNTNRIIIEEEGLLQQTSKALLLEVIDNQIKKLKLDFLSQWERDHSHSDKDCNAQIKTLEAKKEEINQLFENVDSATEKVDLVFSISKQTEAQIEHAHLEYSA